VIQTYTQQLEQVQEAIIQITGGSQSYTIKDRTFTRAHLKELNDREMTLRKLAAREQNGGIGIRAGVPIQ